MNTQPTSPAPSTADRLVHAAMRLFADKGYGSTSIADIHPARGGVNPGSLYHAFPTKQDLLLAVLDLYREGIGPMLLEPAWQGVSDPVARIFALLARYRAALEASDCLYGCPIGSLALELHEPDPPVRERLAANFAELVRRHPAAASTRRSANSPPERTPPRWPSSFSASWRAG